MELLTAIPSLDTLPNPHLMVLGSWSTAVSKVLAKRLDGHAPVVFLCDQDARDFPGKGTIDGRRCDLLRSLDGGAESLSNLASMLLPMAAAWVPPDRPASTEKGVLSSEVAKIFDELMIYASSRDRRQITGLRSIAIAFPATTNPARVCMIIDDMIEHTATKELPPPVARIAQRGSQTRRDIREAKIGIEAGRFAVDAVTILLPVKDDSDWKPYEAMGLTPEIPAAVLAAECEMEAAKLRADPAYARAPANVLADVARDHVDSRLWEIAVDRAGAAETFAREVGTHALIESLKASRLAADFGVMIEDLISGAERVPTWWERNRWRLCCHGCHGLRTAILLEGILDQAMAPGAAGTPKFLLVEASVIRREPIALAALERLLRAGRKYHLFCVLIAGEYGPELGRAGDLTANWLVTHQARKDLPIVRAAPGAAELDPVPAGWWQSSQAPLPQPVGVWYNSEEVAAGDRLLSGASYAQ